MEGAVARGRGARERLLAAAGNLFTRRGIQATSMEDLAGAAPVSKRTLYAHFATKEDLVVAHLEHLVHSGGTLHDVLTRSDIPARERLLALFDLPASPSPVRGCPFVNAAVEYPDPAGPVHATARETKLVMRRTVVDLLDEIGVAEPEALAEQLVTLADGAASRAMVLDDPGYGRYARDAAALLIDHAGRAGDDTAG